MASGATGTPSTNLLIPKINPSVDIPDGSGINSIVDFIDGTSFTGLAKKPTGIISGEVPVWDGAAWVRSSVTKLGYASLALTGNIVNADLATAAAISATKLAAVPAARAYHNVNQSIGSGTHTAVALNAERFDTDTIHDTVTNNGRLTCKTAGKYIIGAHTEWTSNATGLREVHIRLNGGTELGYQDMDPTLGTLSSLTTFYDLAVNDYVEMYVYQNSGSTLNILSSGARSPEFWMVRVSA